MDGWVTRSSRLKRAKVHMATSTDDLAPLSPLLSSNLKRRVDDDSVFKKV